MELKNVSRGFNQPAFGDRRPGTESKLYAKSIAGAKRGLRAGLGKLEGPLTIWSLHLENVETKTENGPGQMDKLCGASVRWNIIQPWKRNSTRYDMGEPWQQTKWKEPDPKASIFYDSIYKKHPEKADPQRQRADSWLSGAWAQGQKSRNW